mgnify:CR=1 FL=1
MRQSVRRSVPTTGAPDSRASELADRLRTRIAQLRADRGRRVAPLRTPRARETGSYDADGTPLTDVRTPGSGVVRALRARELARPAPATATRTERDTAAARGFLRAARGLLRLRDPDTELRVERTDTDALGCLHVRFSQRWEELEVWPSALVVQVRDDGTVDTLSGVTAPTPRRVHTRPTIASPRAAAAARAAVSAGDDATVSEPDLIVFAPERRPSRLAWRMHVTLSAASRFLVVVDAHTGRVLESFDEVAHEDVVGSGTDLLGQTRTLHVWQEGGSYFLSDTSKQMFDPTSDPPNPFTSRGAIAVVDARNSGPDPEPDLFYVTANTPNGFALRDAVSAAFGLSQTYDYFLERHQRNSLDGQGGTMLAVVRVGRNFQNAFWNGQYMAFGDAEPYAASLDVVGHELTHGVTEKTAGLVYKDQSGALNEAFSDIFGEMVEARTTAGNHDWKVGSQLGAALRDMRNPSSILIQAGLPYPSRMSQFIQTSQDNGGVHLNSSIINRAYYLLAEGLPNAVGLAAAERIFYRTLTTKLVKQSRFVDCRIGAIASAEELFGAGSAQARATADAFDAVEIFGSAGTPAPQPAPAIEGDDATLFVYATPGTGALFLGRREDAFGDPSEGVPLSQFDVGPARPSVSADGSLAAFVDSVDDVCVIDTAGVDEEVCAGVPGTVYSVAMSPDASRFAFVLRDGFGDPTNAITVVDIASNTEQDFPLVAPLIDGGTIDVITASTMDFTRDGSVIVYDAFNVVSLADGTRVGLWSIYALELDTGNVYTLVEPTPGLDIANPALAHTTDRWLTFEAVDSVAGTTTIFTLDTFSGDFGGVFQVSDAQILAAPCFTGDDGAVVFSAADATQTGASLFVRNLASDHLNGTGGVGTWLSDAALGVVYRRGDVPETPPPADLDLTFDAGTPRLETLDIDADVGGTAVPIRLELAHDAAGGFTSGGTCTVGGVPVTVRGKLKYQASRNAWRYALTLRAATPKIVVKLKGDVGAATSKVVYSGPGGRASLPLAGVSDSHVTAPTSRVTVSPTVDFFGRVGGSGTLVGGFGNDDGAVLPLSGRLTTGALRLVLKQPGSARRLSFKGVRAGTGWFGRLKFTLPPAQGTLDGYAFDDPFGG